MTKVHESVGGHISVGMAQELQRLQDMGLNGVGEAADELERLRRHRCQHCGRTWERDSNIYDECGDCYREHQDLRGKGVVVHGNDVLLDDGTGGVQRVPIQEFTE